MKIWFVAVCPFILMSLVAAPTSTSHSEIAASCHTALHDHTAEKQCVDMQMAADAYLDALKKLHLPGYDAYMLDCITNEPMTNDETFLVLCMGVHVHQFLYRKIFPPTVQEPDSDDDHFNPPDPFSSAPPAPEAS